MGSMLLHRLLILERTLQWRHMVPTAPDTLACYPFSDRDPFIMQQCPHIYFAGNQPEFQTRVLEGKKNSSRSRHGEC
jgi:DNA polymerase delta subunit 2